MLGNRQIPLTAFEFRLQQKLMWTPGLVFTREELLTSLHPSGGVVIDRVIDVHIGKLRQKVEGDHARPRYILTARGLGYRFTDEIHLSPNERFYRVDPSRSREFGGAGIGLAIVEELVKAHGGRVGVESVGGENRIWFELPA